MDQREQRFCLSETGGDKTDFAWRWSRGGLRSSTVNVPAIVGMGKAVEIAEKSKTENLK